MQTTTTKGFRCLACLCFFLAWSSSCRGDYSLAAGESWFLKNSKALLLLNQMLLERLAIERVDTDLPLKFIPKFKEFNSADQAIYNKSLEYCQALGIKNISITRRGRSPDGDLIAVSYTLRSSGIAAFPGGKMLSVEYIPDAAFLKIYGTAETIVTPLKQKDWYVVRFKDAR